MEYTSAVELYHALLPAFNVKRRLLSITKYKHISNEIIWNYLINNKWKYAIDLTIAEIVADIINVDATKIFISEGVIQ